MKRIALLLWSGVFAICAMEPVQASEPRLGAKVALAYHKSFTKRGGRLRMGALSGALVKLSDDSGEFRLDNGIRLPVELSSISSTWGIPGLSVNQYGTRVAVEVAGILDLAEHSINYVFRREIWREETRSLIDRCREPSYGCNLKAVSGLGPVDYAGGVNSMVLKFWAVEGMFHLFGPRKNKSDGVRITDTSTWEELDVAVRLSDVHFD